MSKIFSPNPVFVQNLEEFKSTKLQYKNIQKVSFKCTNCGKLYTKKICNMRKCEKLICAKCILETNNFKKYGVKYITQLTEVKEKAKQTCLKHYGVLNPSQSEKIKDKKKQTCIKHYGVESPMQCKEVVQTLQQNNMKKYGVKCPFQLTEIKEKVRQTCLEKYEVENPFQNKKIQEKIKQTNLEKYGVENPTYVKDRKEKTKKAWSNKSKEEKLLIKRKREKTLSKLHGSLEEAYKIRSEKIKQTCLEKYGTKNPSQNESIKEKKKQTRIKHYGAGHSINGKYLYEKQSFDSSWELAVWLWAKDLKRNIVREPIGLEYEFKNQKHTYYPDFQFESKLIEIKGSQFFKKDGTMQNPFDHNKDALFEAKHQCGLRHGVEFWGEKEIFPILKYVEKKYGKYFLQKFKKYQEK